MTTSVIVRKTTVWHSWSTTQQSWGVCGCPEKALGVPAISVLLVTSKLYTGVPPNYYITKEEAANQKRLNNTALDNKTAAVCIQKYVCAVEHRFMTVYS